MANNPLYKRLMVGLDFSEIDRHLVNYTLELAKLVGAEAIQFVHTYKRPDLPDDLQNALQQTEKPLGEMLQEDLDELLEELTPDGETAATIDSEVIAGSKLPTIMAAAKEFKADLIIVGRKKGKIGVESGILLPRLARRATCSLLIVPEGANLLMDTMLACVDYSDHSRMAVERSLSFIADMQYTTLYLQHFYHVPSGYHYTGKSYEMAARVMKENATRRHKEFMRELEKRELPQVSPLYTLDEDNQAATLVRDTAASIGAGMVVVGSRGRTFAASILLGSFAERLVASVHDTPLLVVKSGRSNMGVVDAIMKI